MLQGEWIRALGRDRIVREEEQSLLTVIGFAVLFAIGAALIWTMLVLLGDLAYFSADSARAPQFPAPLSVLLPYVIAPAAVLIPLGARFREAWWPAGFVAALTQVPCGWIIYDAILMAAPSSLHVDDSSLFGSIVLPALFYPLATFIGSLAIRRAPREWMFWLAYAVLVATVWVALGYVSARM
jgi:hypothetical protein